MMTTLDREITLSCMTESLRPLSDDDLGSRNHRLGCYLKCQPVSVNDIEMFDRHAERYERIRRKTMARYAIDYRKELINAANDIETLSCLLLDRQNSPATVHEKLMNVVRYRFIASLE